MTMPKHCGHPIGHRLGASSIQASVWAHLNQAAYCILKHPVGRHLLGVPPSLQPCPALAMPLARPAPPNMPPQHREERSGAALCGGEPLGSSGQTAPRRRLISSSQMERRSGSYRLGPFSGQDCMMVASRANDSPANHGDWDKHKSEAMLVGISEYYIRMRLDDVPRTWTEIAFKLARKGRCNPRSWRLRHPAS